MILFSDNSITARPDLPGAGFLFVVQFIWDVFFR